MTESEFLDPCCSPNAAATVAWVHSAIDLPQLVERMVGAMKDEGFSEDDVFAMKLALREALENAVKHGSAGDPSRKVRIRYAISPERVVVEVLDEGAGFDPTRVADPLAPENLERPGGRGLFLMRTYLTWVRFSARGNAVTLCKERSAT